MVITWLTFTHLKALKPAGRFLELAGRAKEPAKRPLELAERPDGAAAQKGDDKDRKTKGQGQG